MSRAVPQDAERSPSAAGQQQAKRRCWTVRWKALFGNRSGCMRLSIRLPRLLCPGTVPPRQASRAADTNNNGIRGGLTVRIARGSHKLPCAMDASRCVPPATLLGSAQKLLARNALRLAGVRLAGPGVASATARSVHLVCSGALVPPRMRWTKSEATRTRALVWRGAPRLRPGVALARNGSDAIWGEPGGIVQPCIDEEAPGVAIQVRWTAPRPAALGRTANRDRGRTWCTGM